MGRHDPQIKVRIPADAKAFIEAEALENGSSQNSEIIRCIRVRMKQKSAAETAISPRHDLAENVEGTSNAKAD